MSTFNVNISEDAIEKLESIINIITTDNIKRISVTKLIRMASYFLIEKFFH